MTTVELKRLHIVRSKGKEYCYAWRGGPRINAERGTPEFVLAYNEAIASHRIPDKKAFHSVIVRYKASPDFRKLAATTQSIWSMWLDRIDGYFGKLKTAQFDRHDKIRPVIRKWRGQYAETPRAADYGIQVLSRVLSYAIDPLGELGANPCEGIKRLYTGSRAGIIWTDEDIAALKVHASVEVGYAVDLAAMTGLRVSDLIKLSWSNVRENAIEIKTGKSRGKREAVIPLYDDLKTLLGKIPRKKSTCILTNSQGLPWTKDGLGNRFAAAKKKTWPDGENLNFHDLRGTAATKLYLAGFSIREIAEILGWEEDTAEQIVRRYVSRTAAIEDKIRRLNEAKNGFTGGV